MSNKPAIVTVESNDAKEFEDKCNQLREAGYSLKASSCGFVQSEKYDFCSSWMAVWGYFPEGE